MIMSQLYPRIFATERVGRSFVGAGVGDDLHEIGIRMVADFFEMEGWDTVYLGANVPAADLVRLLEDRRPAIVGLSVCTTPNLSAALRTIETIRASSGCRGVRIMIGGRAINLVPELGRQMDADGVGCDAQAAIDLANQWVRDGELP